MYKSRGEMGVAVYGNMRQHAYVADIVRFLDMLLSRGTRVWVKDDFSDFLRGCGVEVRWYSCSRFPGEAERAVSIGGDGTFLRTAEWVGASGVPILGINTGHLGFLASYSFHETEELVDVLCGASGCVESRMLLHVDCPGLPADFYPYALNEVAIQKGDSSSMVNVRTWVDGGYLADYLADGLLVATPTGSTGYNLSVGGPILEPTASNIVLSPVAAHSLTMRPLVVEGDAVIEAAVMSRAEQFRLSLDGRSCMLDCPPMDADTPPVIRVTRADYVVNILRRPGAHFASILRKKLLWGESAR